MAISPVAMLPSLADEVPAPPLAVVVDDVGVVCAWAIAGAAASSAAAEVLRRRVLRMPKESFCVVRVFAADLRRPRWPSPVRRTLVH